MIKFLIRFLLKRSMNLSKSQSSASHVSSGKPFNCNSENDTPAPDTAPLSGITWELTARESDIVFGLFSDYSQKSPMSQYVLEFIGKVSIIVFGEERKCKCNAISLFNHCDGLLKVFDFPFDQYFFKSEQTKQKHWLKVWPWNSCLLAESKPHQTNTFVCGKIHLIISYCQTGLHTHGKDFVWVHLSFSKVNHGPLKPF